MARFTSNFRTFDIAPLELPEFSGLRIMMMPLRIGDARQALAPQYEGVLSRIFDCVEARLLGEVGYLTIDEQQLEPNSTLRRPGAHVDGVYRGSAGAWGGGGGGVWGGGGGNDGKGGNGMILVSNTPHCRIFPGVFEGDIGDEGECEHLVDENTPGIYIEPGVVYWCDPLCVHESLPVTNRTARQLIRLSLPSSAPWFEGYTENPDGTLPTGPTLPARTEKMAFASAS